MTLHSQNDLQLLMKTESILRYVLITPVKNEEVFIEKTIESVISQTHKPFIWIIVSDASSDGTDSIVQRYSSEYPWISLFRMPENGKRSFASKVICFNAGLDLVKKMKFDIIGNLDGDVSFGH